MLTLLRQTLYIGRLHFDHGFVKDLYEHLALIEIYYSSRERFPLFVGTPVLATGFLALVESYRLLTSRHIQELTNGSEQGILRRLQKLFHAGYLDRLSPRFVHGGGSARMVYAITNRGMRALQKEAGKVERTTTDWNAQNRALHDLSIAHMLLISHVRAVFSLACQDRDGLHMLFWREGRSLQDTIEVALDKGYRQVPVAPDAFFSLADAKGRVNFFFEADRGTMTIARFTLKLRAYAAYWQQRKHQDKFGIKHFRVLTVTSSHARAVNLCAAAHAIEELRAVGRMFLFTHQAMLSLHNPGRIWGAGWQSATQEATCLIPN